MLQRSQLLFAGKKTMFPLNCLLLTVLALCSTSTLGQSNEREYKGILLPSRMY